MNNLWKRSLSLLLALVMVMGMFPMGIKAEAANADSPLADADGIIWLVKNGDDASQEFINKITGLKLDDMIREAVGETNSNKVVEFDGIDVGSYAGLYMGGEDLKAELVDAVKQRKLVAFTVGGAKKWIAFRELVDVNIEIGEGNQIIIESEGKPENLDQLVENALANPKLTISEGTLPNGDPDVAKLSKTDHEVSTKKNTYHWPVAGEEKVVAGTVTVTIHADDKESEKKSVTAEVILKDTRDVLTLEYYERLVKVGEEEQLVNLLNTFKAYEDEMPEVQDPAREYYTFMGWSTYSSNVESGLIKYVAEWKAINDKDGDGVANEEEVFTITYKVNDEEYEVFKNVKWGEYTPVPDTNPAGTDGKSFAGWGNVAQRVYEDATYEAVFTDRDIVTVTVRYRDVIRTYVFYVDEAGKAVNPPVLGEIEPYYYTGLYYTDAEGKHSVNIETFDFKTTGVTELYADYYTDDDNNGLEDGTAENPIYVYRFADVNGDSLKTIKGLKQMTEAEISAATPAYDPKYWIVTAWTVGEPAKSANNGIWTYTISPKTVEDKNDNGIADTAENDSLVLNLDTTVFNVTYEPGVAVVTYVDGEDTYIGRIYITGLMTDGSFTYNPATTVIEATPLWLDGKAINDDGSVGTMMAYVAELNVDGNTEGVSYQNFNACKGKTENAIRVYGAKGIKIGVNYTSAYLAPASSSVESLQPGLKEYSTKDVYEQIFKAYPTDAEFEADKTLKVTVEYLARTAGDVTVDLKNLYDSLADLIPEEYMDMAKDYVGDSFTINLSEKWLEVKDAPKKEQSAQAVADAFFQSIIDEMEENGFDQAAMADKIFSLKDDLKAELEANAAIHKFGTINPKEPKGVKETVNITYQTEKMYLKKSNASVYIRETRDPITMTAGDLTFGYRCFDDSDLLKNVVVKTKNDKGEDVKVNLSLDELELDRSYVNAGVGTHKVTVSFPGNATYSGASVTFNLTINKVKPIVTIPHTVLHVLDGVIEYKDVKATVTPESATIFHVIAGLEANELAFDSNMVLKDEEIVMKAWIKIPAMYASLINGLEVEGKVIKTGVFMSVEELEVLLDKYTSEPGVKFVKEINMIRGLIDMIPERVINRLGLDDRTYTLQIRLDSFEDTTYPTEPGMYVNFAASTAYLGQVLPEPYGSMFKNDNYEVAEMPTGTGDLGQVRNMSADGGIIVISPMYTIPNSGGVQIFDGKVSNAQNVFVYEYNGKPVDIDLEIAVNGEKLADAEPFYYGVSTRMDLKHSAPTMPGVYMAGYNYTTTTYNETTKEEEVRRLGSDACLIIIKQRTANMTITGGIFEETGENILPKIELTDKNGNVIKDSGMVIISGTANVDTSGTNITADDLYGTINIDFPDALQAKWDEYCNRIWGKDAPEKYTASDVISFLEECGDKAAEESNKAIDKFQSMGISEALDKVLEKIGKDSVDMDGKAERAQNLLNSKKAQYDKLIEELRPLATTDNNLYVTFYDLATESENLPYHKTGAYLYMGVITDPDLTIDAAKGVVIIHSAEDYIMYDTHVPYDGKSHDIYTVDDTMRGEITLILDREDDAYIAVDPVKKEVYFMVDEEMAEVLIDEFNKIFDTSITGESDVYVGTVYTKTGNFAKKVTTRIMDTVSARVLAQVNARFPAGGEAAEKALAFAETKLINLETKVLNKLQQLDTLENGTRIYINGALPVDLGPYEVTAFDFNVNEVNIVLEGDLLGAINAALNKAGFKTISNGADGYVVTGYEKAEDVAKVITDIVINKIRTYATMAIYKIDDLTPDQFEKLTPEQLKDITADRVDAKTQELLAALNAKLVVFESRLLNKLQSIDGMDNDTRIVLNGKYPVEVGTYDFVGFDYDVSATRGVLVIEPIYIELDDEPNSKYEHEADPNPLTNVNVSYYSYSGNSLEGVKKVAITTLPNGKTEADLVSYNVTRTAGEAAGLYDMSVHATLLDNTGRYKMAEHVEDGQDFEIYPEMGTIEEGRWTMSLDEVIYLNYYPVLNGWSESYDFLKYGGVVVWVDDLDTPTPTLSSQLTIGAENTVTLPMYYNEEKGEYYVKTSEIFAKNIGDMVYVRPFVRSASDPDNLDKVVYLEKAKGYSPARFCYDVMTDAAEPDEKQITCAALLEYGTSAQDYFNYDEDHMVNVIPAGTKNKWVAAQKLMAQYKENGDLEFDASYLTGLYVDDHIRNLSNTTLTGTRFNDILDGKKTLDLQGAIRLSVSFNLDSSIDWNEVEYAKVMFWSQPTIMATDDLSYEAQTYDYICDLKPENPDAEVKLGDYRAQSQHIKAKNLGDSVYYYCIIKLKGSDEIHRSKLIVYSPERSVYDHLNDSINVNNVDEVSRKIAVYSEMARRLFDWNLNE